MKKLLPIILIIAGLALGFFGFQKLNNSSAGIEIGSIELKAEDEESSNMAYGMIGLGIAFLVGGAVQATKK
ncbi:MAG: hypothetical protein AB8H03_14455 [Saprospiraceae bacterium]